MISVGRTKKKGGGDCRRYATSNASLSTSLTRDSKGSANITVIAVVCVLIIVAAGVAFLALGNDSNNNGNKNRYGSIDVPSDFKNVLANDFDGNGIIDATDYAMAELEKWSKGGFLSQNDQFKYLDQIIDPRDPEGSLLRAEKSLFPASELSVFTKAKNLLDMYTGDLLTNAGYKNVGNNTASSLYYVLASTSPERWEFVRNDWSGSTFTFNHYSFSGGRTVTTKNAYEDWNNSTMSAYLSLTEAVRGAAYGKAFVQYGREEAWKMYDGYFNLDDYLAGNKIIDEGTNDPFLIKVREMVSIINEEKKNNTITI